MVNIFSFENEDSQVTDKPLEQTVVVEDTPVVENPDPVSAVPPVITPDVPVATPSIEDTTGVVVEDTTSVDVEVFDETDTVESRMLGMTEISRELESELEDSDVQIDVLEDVEQLAETVRESVDEGGLDTLSARTIQTSVESFMAISGVEPLIKSRISLEGFEDPKQRNTKTISLEAQINENKKSIMKSILEAIKRAYEWLVEFISKVVDTAKRMKVKALAMKEKVNAVTELEIKDIDVKDQYQILRIGNVFPNTDKLIDGLSIIREKAVAVICKGMADRMHTVVENKGNIVFDVEELLKDVKSKASNLTSQLPKAISEKFNIVAEELKLGNKVIVYTWPKESISNTEKFVYSLLIKEANIIDLPQPNQTQESPKEVSIKSLEKSDSLKVIDEVVKNLDALIKIPDSKNELKRLISDAERLSRDNSSDESQSKLLTDVAKGCQSISNKIMKLQSSYRNYVIKTSNASLQIVAKSLTGVKVENENTTQTPALA